MAIIVLTPEGAGAGDPFVALGSIIGPEQEFHDLGIGRHGGKRVEIIVAPFPQQEARRAQRKADLRAARRQSGQYAAAIPADIADLAVMLPAEVIVDAEEASHLIARFDAELGDEIAPFTSVLLRTESAASSNIENLTASARAIAEAEALGDTSRRNAAMIVANTKVNLLTAT